MFERGRTPEANREREQFSFGVASEPSAKHPDRNEDAYFAAPERGVFAVFDGMGGHVSGDVASQLAREVLAERLSSLPQQNNQDITHQWLNGALRDVDRTIAGLGQKEFQSRSMGAAGTIFVVSNLEGKPIGLAGTAADTRVWLFRNDHLRQVTIDNIDGAASESDASSNLEMLQRLNGVKDIQDIQLLNQDDRYMFYNRNRVDNYLGSGQHHPRIESFELRPHDRLLLSSDGIHDNLTADEIASVLAEITDSTEAAKHLVWKSQQTSRSESIRAKPDDMTALVVEITGQ